MVHEPKVLAVDRYKKLKKILPQGLVKQGFPLLQMRTVVGAEKRVHKVPEVTGAIGLNAKTFAKAAPGSIRRKNPPGFMGFPIIQTHTPPRRSNLHLLDVSAKADGRKGFVFEGFKKDMFRPCLRAMERRAGRERTCEAPERNPPQFLAGQRFGPDSQFPTLKRETSVFDVTKQAALPENLRGPARNSHRLGVGGDPGLFFENQAADSPARKKEGGKKSTRAAPDYDHLRVLSLHRFLEQIKFATKMEAPTAKNKIPKSGLTATKGEPSASKIRGAKKLAAPITRRRIGRTLTK
jgi:hypothetical protein